MKGAIIGDIIGSAFVNDNLPTTEFQLFKPTSAFTDDTVLTLATADSIINERPYKKTLIEWTQRFPQAGYRADFLQWALMGGNKEYKSDGDGAARRISPIGFAANSIEEALTESMESTLITHNVPVRIEAAQATAVAVFMAKSGATRKEIKQFISVHFGYDLNLSVAHWKSKINLGETLSTPVPPAIAAFLEASDFEEAIRLAILIGGPSNTIASITGALAQAYFKHIPKAFIKRALARLTPDMEAIIEAFDVANFQEKATADKQITTTAENK
jgi:ADP-ribosylglycohydrolase